MFWGKNKDPGSLHLLEHTARDALSGQPYVLDKHRRVHPVPLIVVQEVFSSDVTSQDLPWMHQGGLHHLHMKVEVV